jgi:hypothetical protein
VHLNVGGEIDADDLERSQIRYALGTSLQAWSRGAVLLEVIGKSTVTSDRFTVPVRALGFALGGQARNGRIARSDIVDLAASLRVRLSRSGVAFVGAIVPLTDDGVRADVVPGGGIEFAF